MPCVSCERRYISLNLPKLLRLQAKKEFNYARFFSILRSPSTPYLFACIMFKYVETMRRVAFRVFSKTYGARTKDNEAVYDAYPLKTLVRVLCFEDLDEARAACKHFNITVKEVEVKSSSGLRVEDIIFWRQSSFREPKDPEKGFTIPLKPRKMIRTIESKLNGATRLAVCRGAVSGEGSSLGEDSITVRAGSNRVGPAEHQQLLDEMRKREEIATKVCLQKEEERQKRQRQEEQILLLEKQRAMFEEKRRQEEEAERVRLQNAKEEAKRRFQAEREAAEREEKEKTRRRQAEAEAREKAEEEETRRREAERRREEEIREKERLAELERAEQERKRKEALELERRRIEEARRKEEEEERKIRELERKRKEKERLEKEEEAIRLHHEWKKIVDSALKRVAWRRLLQKVPQRVALSDQTHQSMMQIGYGSDARRMADSIVQLSSRQVVRRSPRVEHVRFTLEKLVRQRDALPIPELLREVAVNLPGRGNPQLQGTFLYKVAVCLPDTDLPNERSLCSLARMWLADRLGYGNVFQGETKHCGIRVAFVDGSVQSYRADCDAAIVVALPKHRDDGNESDIPTECLIPPGIPCVGLFVSEDYGETRQRMESVSSSFVYAEIVDATRSESVESGLFSSIRSIVETVVALAPRRIERVSVLDMCYRCMNKAIWYGSEVETHHDILKRVHMILQCLLAVFGESGKEVGYSGWPSPEFATNRLVRDYYGERLHLPLDWRLSLEIANVEAKVVAVKSCLDGHLYEVVTRLVGRAPGTVQQECQAMLDERAFRRCLQMSLAWKVQEEERDKNSFGILYMPVGMLHRLVEDAGCRFSDRLSIENEQTYNGMGSFDYYRNYEWPQTLSPPKGPLQANQDAQAASEVLPVETAPAQTSASKQADHEDTPEPDNESRRKRRRFSKGKQLGSLTPSKDVADSIAYTKRLQAMLGGETGTNRIVGRTTLSKLLRDIPSDLIEPND